MNLGAAGALLYFLEHEMSFHLHSGSLKLTNGSLDKYVRMNMETVASLELIQPLQGARNSQAKAACLYQFLNKTKTRLGARSVSAQTCNIES